MHPFFDIHLHPPETFIFRCLPSLSNTRIARPVQIELLWSQKFSYFMMRIPLMQFGAQQNSFRESSSRGAWKRKIGIEVKIQRKNQT